MALQIPNKKQVEEPSKQTKILESTHTLIKTYAAQNGLMLYEALDVLVKAALGSPSLLKKKQR